MNWGDEDAVRILLGYCNTTLDPNKEKGAIQTKSIDTLYSLFLLIVSLEILFEFQRIST
jgi:hypothetical protein